MDEIFRIEEAKVISETQKAILVRAPVFDNPVWIPKSQVHDDSEVYDINSAEGDLLILERFAEVRGWA